MVATAHGHVCLSRVAAAVGDAGAELDHIRSVLALRPHLTDVDALGAVHTRAATASATVLLDDAHVLSDSDFTDASLLPSPARPLSRSSAYSDTTSDDDVNGRSHGSDVSRSRESLGAPAGDSANADS